VISFEIIYNKKRIPLVTCLFESAFLALPNPNIDAVLEPLIGHFFFFDIWIQHEKLDKL